MIISHKYEAPYEISYENYNFRVLRKLCLYTQIIETSHTNCKLYHAMLNQRGTRVKEKFEGEMTKQAKELLANAALMELVGEWK